MDRAIEDPDAYRQGGASAPTSMLAASPQSSLTLWQTMCNTIYYHPFKTIVAIASPLYAGGIFYVGRRKKRRGGGEEGRRSASSTRACMARWSPSSPQAASCPLQIHGRLRRVSAFVGGVDHSGRKIT